MPTQISKRPSCNVKTRGLLLFWVASMLGLREKYGTKTKPFCGSHILGLPHLGDPTHFGRGCLLFLNSQSPTNVEADDRRFGKTTFLGGSSLPVHVDCWKEGDPSLSAQRGTQGNTKQFGGATLHFETTPLGTSFTLYAGMSSNHKAVPLNKIADSQ